MAPVADDVNLQLNADEANRSVLSVPSNNVDNTWGNIHWKGIGKAGATMQEALLPRAVYLLQKEAVEANLQLKKFHV